jgi:hypothetical protein
MAYKNTKHNLSAILYIIVLLLSETMLISCEEKNQTKLENKIDLHLSICPENAPAPPPIENTVLSSEKLNVANENGIATISINLIADKLVDYQGSHQQIFRIEVKGTDRKMLFALPTKYNTSWNNLAFNSEKKDDSITLGLWIEKKYIELYKIHAYKYQNKNFGSGEIIIHSIGSSTYTTI